MLQKLATCSLLLFYFTFTSIIISSTNKFSLSLSSETSKQKNQSYMYLSSYVLQKKGAVCVRESGEMNMYTWSWNTRGAFQWRRRWWHRPQHHREWKALLLSWKALFSFWRKSPALRSCCGSFLSESSLSPFSISYSLPLLPTSSPNKCNPNTKIHSEKGKW